LTGERVRCRIDSRRKEGRWGRCAAEEEVAEEENGVGDVDATAVVRVLRVQAGGAGARAITREEAEQDADRVREISPAVGVRIAAPEVELVCRLQIGLPGRVLGAELVEAQRLKAA
jgi:hypothetical protein